MDKEGKKMETVQERLADANNKVNIRLDDIWKQAENNLKQSEIDFYKRKERGKKD
jgi:hypothetical protein